MDDSPSAKKAHDASSKHQWNIRNAINEMHRAKREEEYMKRKADQEIQRITGKPIDSEKKEVKRQKIKKKEEQTEKKPEEVKIGQWVSVEPVQNQRTDSEGDKKPEEEKKDDTESLPLDDIKALLGDESKPKPKLAFKKRGKKKEK